MEARKNLYQAGILMFLGGIISIFILLKQNYQIVVWMMNGAAQSSPIYLALGLLSLLGVIFQIYIGYRGIKAYREKSAAATCLKLGIVFVCLNLLIMLTIVIVQKNGGAFARALFSQLIPAFYIYGAAVCKKHEEGKL